MSAPSPAHAEAQRNRILDAAQRGFIERGFHAASMANIAETAGMSAGLIYRYFENKHAIILAIIERQLTKQLADIASLEADSDPATLIAELFIGWRCGDPRCMNPVLFLEISAEASRTPSVAEALVKADQAIHEQFNTWLIARAKTNGHEPAPEEIEHGSFLLRSLIIGLAVRAVREPDLCPEKVKNGLRCLLGRGQKTEA